MNKTHTVFIDGQAGTTGLQIKQRLSNHPYIQLLEIESENRKNVAVRKELMSNADVTILCLPDDAAKEAVQISHGTGTRILDASSAHRTHTDWAYGYPELNHTQRTLINTSTYVANPGCYATGAIALLAPLIDHHALQAESLLSINAVSGFSGGGNKMIDRYQTSDAPIGFSPYGLAFDHKHIPEIQEWSGLINRPLFQPAVGNFKQGMLVFIPLNFTHESEKIVSTLMNHYEHEKFVKVVSVSDESAREYVLNPEDLNNSNNLELYVFSSKKTGQTLLAAKLDNLGKGASGAAVQNLNIMLGFDEAICVNI